MEELHELQERIGSEMDLFALASKGDLNMSSIWHELDGMLREFAMVTLRAGGVTDAEWRAYVGQKWTERNQP